MTFLFPNLIDYNFRNKKPLLNFCFCLSIIFYE